MCILGPDLVLIVMLGILSSNLHSIIEASKRSQKLFIKALPWGDNESLFIIFY